MEKKYSDYQIMSLEKAADTLGSKQAVADAIGCSGSLITYVLQRKRVLPPMMCVKLAQQFSFVDIHKMSDVYSENVMKWIEYQNLDRKYLVKNTWHMLSMFGILVM